MLFHVVLQLLDTSRRPAVLAQGSRYGPASTQGLADARGKPKAQGQQAVTEATVGCVQGGSPTLAKSSSGSKV
jgi:hypothetical protein